MKFALILFCLIFFPLNTFSQNQVLVPFRVGDKFGLSDLKGQLIYPAEYDKITLRYNDPAGVFYAKKENKTTFFYKNIILIKDTKSIAS